MDKWQAVKAGVGRFQEFLGWLPLVVVVAVLVWVVIGALVQQSEADSVAALIALPVIAAYALAAAGMTYISWRRWRMWLKPEQQDDYWNRLMAGERGAVVVFCVNAVVWLACFFAWLYFFRLAR